MNRPGKNRNKQLDKSRPRIRITLTPLEFILEMVSLLGLVGAAYLLIRFWPDLPMVIPKHFGFSGEVDGWGDRSSLFFLPGANLFLYIMLTVMSRFPHTFNYPVRVTADNARRQYQLSVWYMALLKAQVVWLFLYLEWRIIQVALGHSSGLGTWFVVVVLVGLLLPTLIYALAARKSR